MLKVTSSPKGKKKEVIKKPSKSTYGITYRGVCLTSKPLMNGEYKFRSRISKDGIRYYLGVFTEVDQAAMAYNKKAKKLFGGEKKAKNLKRWNVIENN